jgi:hypothetical protein
MAPNNTATSGQICATLAVIAEATGISVYLILIIISERSQVILGG